MVKKSFYQKSNRFSFCLTFLLCLGLTCHFYAQTQGNKKALISYLQDIESRHEVYFSFADDLLQNITISPLEDSKTLDDHLNYLKVQTSFDYIIQNDKTILVIPKTNADKICITFYDAISKDIVRESKLEYNNLTFLPDKDGKFYLPAKSTKYPLKVYAQDYITKSINIEYSKKRDCLKFYITPFYHLLDEVVLTSLLTRGIQKTASGGLEINYEEFGLLPGLVEPDVLQSLQALPGITSRRESVSFLNVRGGTHDQNLFLWDGIKMYNTSVFFGMISAFNPYTTKNVKLVKNGTSAKYGDGVSSLIDMRTSNSIADSLKVAAGINLISADVIIDLPFSESSSIEFASRHSINAIWESPTYNSYFDKVFQNTAVTNFVPANTQQTNYFSFYDGSLIYKNQISTKDFIKTSIIYSEDRFDLNRFDIQQNNFINTRISNLAQSNIAAGIFYERYWSQTTRFQTQLYSSLYNQNAVNLNIRDEQELEQINQVGEIGLKINVQNQLYPNLILESGYQLNTTGITNSQEVNNPGFFAETQNSILTNSIYTQLNYQSENDLLNLNLGTRLNHFSEFDKFKFEPRLNLSYQFVKDLFLEVLAEQKSQVTSQTIDLQTDFLGVENRRWVLSQPDEIPIVESQQISVGFNFIKPNWFVNLDLFHKRVDGITVQGQGFQNQFEFSAGHGSYDVTGLDILVNKSFDPITGWVSYSLSENNYDFRELNPSSFHSNLDLRHVISTGLSYEKNGLKISGGFNWHSGASITLPSEEQDNLLNEIRYGSPNSARLKDYFRLDFSSTYSFKLYRKISALAGISFLNVFDNTNVYNQFYGIDNANIQTFQQNGLGFTPNIVLRVNF